MITCSGTTKRGRCQLSRDPDAVSATVMCGRGYQLFTTSVSRVLALADGLSFGSSRPLFIDSAFCERANDSFAWLRVKMQIKCVDKGVRNKILYRIKYVADWAETVSKVKIIIHISGWFLFKKSFSDNWCSRKVLHMCVTAGIIIHSLTLILGSISNELINN